jgi:hypothetical protein
VPEKVLTNMTTAMLTSRDFVDTIAVEMACGIDVAVESWMAAMESALTNPELTTIGRINAAKELLETYKRLTGKTQLQLRREWCPED